LSIVFLIMSLLVIDVAILIIHLIRFLYPVTSSSECAFPSRASSTPRTGEGPRKTTKEVGDWLRLP
jgi:hypothetical protein